MNSLEQRIAELERAIVPNAFLSPEELRKYALMLFTERGTGYIDGVPEFTEEDWKWYWKVSKAIVNGRTNTNEEKGKAS